MSLKLYTTVQVAEIAGIPRATLQFWIASGKLAVPEVQLRDGKAVRLWTDADIKRARNLKGKLKRGPSPKEKKRKKK